jgi:ketosteroid isomerase-like protein
MACIAASAWIATAVVNHALGLDDGRALLFLGSAARDTGRAMSKENVEIVRSALEPFDGIDVAGIDFGAEAIRDALASAYSPDVELRTLRSGLGSGVGEFYRGLDGGIQYLREWLEPFVEYRVKNLDYVEAGDCVLVPSRQWGVGAGSGARVEIELTTLYELQDGQIARIEQYDTLEDALEAVGLRE